LKLRFLTLIILALANQIAFAQMATPKSTETKANSITDAPVIDGDVINDPVWNSIVPFGNLIQTRPNRGNPSTEKTEIRIAYTTSTFYLSVVCYDSQPDKLVVSDARRDAPLDNTDAFLFILDTYNDGQNGFVFGTNAIAVQYDAQVDNEGQGNFNSNRQAGGTIGGFNINWDASWEVKTEVGDYGWSAEFAIPFRTLRFATGEDVTWGANFQRIIRKNNEIDFWSPIPIDFDLKRLSLAGKLSGLKLQSPGNLKIIPYGLMKVYRDVNNEPIKTKVDGEIGGDIKYSITPSLTLDLTYNTDFAQVEVDEQQINLDRFNLFFPEKRPFFLENAGLFSVGSPGEVDLFFSRRIGIDEGGLQVPIIGGARLSGKIKNTNLGLMSLFTDKVDTAGIERNNFSIVRINQQLAPRSTIGAAFINREGLGDSNAYNRVYAIDGKLGLGKKAQLIGFYSQSSTPGIGINQHAFKLQSQYTWNGWELNLAYTEVGEGFNPEMGFLFRTAFRKPELLVLKRVRMNGKLGLLEIRPHVSYRGYWNFDNFLETGFLHIDNHWEFLNGIEIHTGVNITTEGVVDPFEIYASDTVRTGTYNHAEGQLIIMTNKSKPVYLSTRSVVGGFFGGKRYANSGTLGVRFGDKFNSEFTYANNYIDLPEFNFTTHIFAGRLSYAFTPSIYIQSLVQYNSVADLWSVNARFGWLQQANAGLFLVYNQVSGNNSPVNRSFIIKYSRVIDILRK